MADVSISYKGDEIATMNATGVKTLLTSESFCEDDITITYTKPSAPEPTLQTKTVTPTSSQQTVSPDRGYDGLSSVTVQGDNHLLPYNIADGVTIFGVTGTWTGGFVYYSDDVEYRGFDPYNSNVTVLADWNEGRAWITGYVDWDAGAEVGEVDFTGIGSGEYSYLIDDYIETFWLINSDDPTDIVTQGTYSDGVFSVDASYITNPYSTTRYYIVPVHP